MSTVAYSVIIRVADEARDNGRNLEAAEKYGEAFRLAHQAGDHERAGYALHMQGVCLKADFGKAIPILENAVEYFRQHSMPDRVGNVLRDLGSVCADAYKLNPSEDTAAWLDRAKEYVEQALQVTNQDTDASGYGVTQAKLGHLLMLQSLHDEADKKLQEALEHLEDWFNLATWWWYAAQLATAIQNYEEALGCLHNMVNWIEIGTEYEVSSERLYGRRRAEHWGLKAHCHVLRGELIEARSALRQCLRYLEPIDELDRQVIVFDIKLEETRRLLNI